MNSKCGRANGPWVRSFHSSLACCLIPFTSTARWNLLIAPMSASRGGARHAKRLTSAHGGLRPDSATSSPCQYHCFIQPVGDRGQHIYFRTALLDPRHTRGICSSGPHSHQHTRLQDLYVSIRHPSSDCAGPKRLQQHLNQLSRLQRRYRHGSTEHNLPHPLRQQTIQRLALPSPAPALGIRLHRRMLQTPLVQRRHPLGRRQLPASTRAKYLPAIRQRPHRPDSDTGRRHRPLARNDPQRLPDRQHPSALILTAGTLISTPEMPSQRHPLPARPRLHRDARPRPNLHRPLQLPAHLPRVHQRPGSAVEVLVLGAVRRGPDVSGRAVQPRQVRSLSGESGGVEQVHESTGLCCLCVGEGG